MGGFLTSLIAGFVTGETRHTARQLARAAIFYALAAIAFMIGVGFLIGAFYVWLSTRYGAQRATLWIGGGFVALAILILLVHLAVRAVTRRTARKRRKEEMTGVMTAAAVALIPALLSKARVGRSALMLAPLAIVAYEIWRENTTPRRRGTSDKATPPKDD